MQVVHCREPVYFDVDDTLVMWGESHNENAILITCPETDYYLDGELSKVSTWSEVLLPNKKHISKLIRLKAEGHTIVVWSQGGHDWAEAVVKALKLEDYVDLVIQKPTQYYDDLDASSWLKERKYLK